MTSRSDGATLPSLYELTQQLSDVINALVDAGGEITPETVELLAVLEQAEGDFKTKAERVALAIRSLIAHGEAAAEESNRLKLLAKARLNSADRLKEYLKESMLTTEVLKVETDRVRISVVKNSRPSITWLGEPASIPEAFRRTTITLDGDAAYDAWKAREGHLPEGFAVKLGTQLRIA